MEAERRRTSRVFEKDSHASSRGVLTAAAILVFGLFFVAAASLNVASGIASERVLAFESACGEIALNIKDRLAASELVLRAGVALFDASDDVSRDEWRAFAGRLDLESHLPGVQGVGYECLVPREELAGHENEMRAQGLDGYRVWPAGERPVYSAIIYLEPFAGLNLRAIGYDMLTEPVRRAAMERARDENDVALSGKLRLVQETGPDEQAGTVMYIPVYQSGVPIATVEERRVAIKGWVSSPYRMDDLIRGTVQGLESRIAGIDIGLRIFDGESLSADGLLFDSGAGSAAEAPDSRALVRAVPIDFAGRRWMLRFSAASGTVGFAEYALPLVLGISGSVVCLLAFFLAVSLFRTRESAGLIAAQLTARLRENEERYRSVFDASLDAMLLTAPDGEITAANAAACEMFGYSADELQRGGRSLILDSSDPRAPEALQTRARTGFFHGELTFLRAGGERFPGEISSSVFRDSDGKERTSMSIRDVTERRRADEARRRAFDEKQALLRELQHRAKNSFAMISSLISLKAASVEHAASREILADLDARVRSISELYALLYTHDSFEAAPLDEYCRNLVASVTGLSEGVDFEFELERILVPASVAAPLGLIVVELATNAVKYAFPDGGRGTVRLVLAAAGGVCRLSVEDDGIGISAEPAAADSPSMGFTIVRSLADQIDGRFSIERRPAGTRCTVEFPVPRAD